jgi:hypothetical protein
MAAVVRVRVRCFIPTASGFWIHESRYCTAAAPSSTQKEIWMVLPSTCAVMCCRPHVLWRFYFRGLPVPPTHPSLLRSKVTTAVAVAVRNMVYAVWVISYTVSVTYI